MSVPFKSLQLSPFGSGAQRVQELAGSNDAHRGVDCRQPDAQAVRTVEAIAAVLALHKADDASRFYAVIRAKFDEARGGTEFQPANAEPLGTLSQAMDDEQ